MKNLYGRLWRWHFLAALIVIPFVLWQSVTGTLYLWSEWWMDQAHPELRFVRPQQHALAVSEQIQAALKAVDAGPAVQALDQGASSAATMHAGHTDQVAVPHAANTAPPNSAVPHHGIATPGLAVQAALLPEDPARSTTVLFQGSDGLPSPVLVDPYTGEV